MNSIMCPVCLTRHKYESYLVQEAISKLNTMPATIIIECVCNTELYIRFFCMPAMRLLSPKPLKSYDSNTV